MLVTDVARFDKMCIMCVLLGDGEEEKGKERRGQCNRD